MTRAQVVEVARPLMEKLAVESENDGKCAILMEVLCYIDAGWPTARIKNALRKNHGPLIEKFLAENGEEFERRLREAMK